LALDPDKAGAPVWRMNVLGPLTSNVPEAEAGRLAGVFWGGATDGKNVYYGLTGTGGRVAIDLATGKRVWITPAKGNVASAVKEDVANQPPASYASPVTLIPGVAFFGGSDGNIIAASTEDGATLWNFDTGVSFDTVNKVAAHGGSFGSQGVVVANGMLFAGSGYSVSNVRSGNVLLAFSLE